MALGRAGLKKLADRAWRLAHGEEPPRAWRIQTAQLPTRSLMLGGKRKQIPAPGVFVSQKDDVPLAEAAIVYEQSARQQLTAELAKLSQKQRKQLLELWHQRLIGPASSIRELMEALANSPTPAQFADFIEANDSYNFLNRASWPDILPLESDDTKLMELRDQLRTVWTEASSGVQGETPNILGRWWQYRPVTDPSAWVIIPEESAIFPSESNTRALMASVCFTHFELMGRCASCQRFFFKYRPNKQYCPREECQRFAGRVRQKRFYYKPEKTK